MDFNGDLMGFDWDIPSGKLTVCDGQSPFLTDKSTINGPFSIAMLNLQRVMGNICVFAIADDRKNGIGENCSPMVLHHVNDRESITINHSYCTQLLHVWYIYQHLP